MRNRVLIALCALAVGAIALELFIAGNDQPRPREQRAGRPAAASTAAFVDSVGVAMHLNYIDTAYGRQAEVLDRLRELGVRHIREGFPYRAPALARGLRAVARMGVSATLVTDVKIPVEVGVAGGLREMGARVEAFEGPNELDASGLPDWRERLGDYLRALRQAIGDNGSSVPVVGPSFIDLRHYRGLEPSGYDVISLHPYPDALPPEERLGERVAEARAVAPGRRVAITETGYQNALRATGGPLPTSERATAAYIPRALLWAFAAGVERTFLYEFVDEKPDPGLMDPEQHFGLLRQDLSRKPAYLAVRNLIRAVRRTPGDATGVPPVPSVRAPERIERVNLTRGDGSRLVALWRPVSIWDRDRRRAVDPGRVAVDVTWPRTVRDLVVSRPSIGDRPAMRRESAAGVRLELAGDVVLLSYR